MNGNFGLAKGYLHCQLPDVHRFGVYLLISDKQMPWLPISQKL